MRRLPQLLAIILSGCVRSSSPQVPVLEEDESITAHEGLSQERGAVPPTLNGDRRKRAESRILE